MNPLRQQQWHNILQMTQQLQEMASDEQWESMVSLTRERQERLQRFFETTLDPDDITEVEAGIQLMLGANERFMEDGQVLRQQAISEAKKMATGRKAIHAYSKFK